MDRSGSRDEAPVQYAQAPAAPGLDNVAILGQSPAPSEFAICPEIVAESASPQGPVNVANVLRLLERQQYRCALTGRLLTPDSASLDHVVPVRCGGEHLIENTQVLHKDVNRAKGTMDNQEFITLCRDVAAHTASSAAASPVLPQRSERLES